MKGGVEESRVQAEPADNGRMLFGQRDLGKQFLSASPGAQQALEGGAVVVAAFREALVEAFDAHRFSGARRPGGEVVRRGRNGCARGEEAGGVAGPSGVGALGVLRVGLRSGVHVNGALPVRRALRR